MSVLLRYFCLSYFDPCCSTKRKTRCTLVVSSFGPYHRLVHDDTPTERTGVILTSWAMPLILFLVQSFWGASGTCCHRPWRQSIAKWHSLLKLKPLLYDGDRQAPLNLTNLLQRRRQMADPSRWLTCHVSYWNSYVG